MCLIALWEAGNSRRECRPIRSRRGSRLHDDLRAEFLALLGKKLVFGDFSSCVSLLSYERLVSEDCCYRDSCCRDGRLFEGFST